MRRNQLISLLIVALLLLVNTSAIAQTEKDKGISLDFKTESLPEVFKRLERTTSYKVLFVYNEVSQYSTQGPIRSQNIQDAMKKIIGNHPLDYKIEKQFISVTPKKKTAGNNSPGLQQSEKKDVTGRVVDANGVPLAGVNVVIYGTQTGTVTNPDGRFTLNMDPEGVLSASFIGFKTDIIPLKGKTAVNITLESSSTQIDEVAVVAFGTQKKESVVSAITVNLQLKVYRLLC